MDQQSTTVAIHENAPVNLPESPKPTYPLIDFIFPPLENGNALQSRLGQERTTQQDAIPSDAANSEPAPNTPISPNSSPTSDPDSFQTAAESLPPQGSTIPFLPPLPAHGCGFPYGAFPMMNAPFGMFPFAPQGPTVPFPPPPSTYGFPYPPYGTFPMMLGPFGMLPFAYPSTMTTNYPSYSFPVPPAPGCIPQVPAAPQPAQNPPVPRRNETEVPTQAPFNQETSRKRKQAPTP
ncbi:hypothetical protein B9Z55_007359 [Caenorhabditis nigoni]|uniref:Uncharacterized protein n=1 Tax=Caenorhabditis nigoni TaxID=1611254 RepID=A0A2G5V988_9PELO|nr:hypothetical protein B9Z55_007359 [Caenorhabditis nigoni]